MFYFRKAVDLNPEDPYIWTQLGITLSRMGRQGESLRAYDAALEFDPEYVIAKWHMALTYRSIGLYEDALRYFQECRDSDDRDRIH